MNSHRLQEEVLPNLFWALQLNSVQENVFIDKDS